MSDEIKTPATTGTGRILRGTRVEIGSDVGRAYVVDHARNEEGLLSDEDLITKWGLTNQQVADLATDAELHRLIQAERDRRVRSGVAVTELSQIKLLKGPHILADIAAGNLSSDANKIAAVAAQAKLAERGLKSGAVVGGGERVNFSILLAPQNPDGSWPPQDDPRNLNITIPAPPGSTPDDFGTTIEHEPPPIDDGDKS